MDHGGRHGKTAHDCANFESCKEHADFKRKGADLFIERKISLVEAGFSWFFGALRAALARSPGIVRLHHGVDPPGWPKASDQNSAR